jgi:hypothetical protein
MDSYVLRGRYRGDTLSIRHRKGSEKWAPFDVVAEKSVDENVIRIIVLSGTQKHRYIHDTALVR